MPIGTISDTTWAGVNAPRRASRLSQSRGFEAGILLKTIKIVLFGRGQ